MRVLSSSPWAITRAVRRAVTSPVSDTPTDRRPSISSAGA